MTPKPGPCKRGHDIKHRHWRKSSSNKNGGQWLCRECVREDDRVRDKQQAHRVEDSRLRQWRRGHGLGTTLKAAARDREEGVFNDPPRVRATERFKALVESELGEETDG